MTCGDGTPRRSKSPARFGSEPRGIPGSGEERVVYGTLDEFSLGDILQLYQISGRTGMVRVRQNGSPAHVVYVDRGRVSGAGADDWNLIDEIRRIEWLTNDVKSQLDFMENDGGVTGLSLIARALLSSHAWDYFTELQLEQLVYPAITWTYGAFEAEVDDIPRVAPLRINQSPQELVLNAARWEEEVRTAEANGFPLDSTWVRIGDPDANLPGNPDEPCQVISLMGRPRSITEIAAAAGLSSLRVIDQIRLLAQSEQVRRRG
jgi:hypothetical protein